MKNIIQIPREQTFDLPVGSYNAAIHSIKVRTKSNSCDKRELRILFQVNVPGMEKKIALAGTTYDLDFRRGSKLRNLIEMIKGPEWFESMQGESFDLDTLIGSQVELELHHITRPPYDKPMVVIESIGMSSPHLDEAA